MHPPSTMCPPWVLCQVCVCLSRHHSANLLESAGRIYNTPLEVFWNLSLYGVLTNWAQWNSVTRTNTCGSLSKDASPHVLSHAGCSQKSFHLYLLQPNIPSCLPWPFTSVCFRNTLLHIFAPAKHHPTQMTFHRNLKFPLHTSLFTKIEIVPGHRNTL